jgi:hypothetical protein
MQALHDFQSFVVYTQLGMIDSGPKHYQTSDGKLIHLTDDGMKVIMRYEQQRRPWTAVFLRKQIDVLLADGTKTFATRLILECHARRIG